MKIIVLGSTGMLGTAVSRYMSEQFGTDSVVLSYRKSRPACDNEKFYFDALSAACNFDYLDYSFGRFASPGDYVINCIGIIKPLIIPGSELYAIFVNSVFPRSLATYCRFRRLRLIHITTDCVFSGKKGNYTEEDEHDCIDIYGKTKSLGEPSTCMVIRTSIIGEEQYNKLSLVEWAKSQRGKEVNGFVNHFWNGITTKQYAKVCERIIKDDLYEEDLFHVFSPDRVSKYNLLQMINDKFDLRLKISRYQAGKDIDRTLSTVKHLNGKLSIPPIEEQVEEM